MSHHHAPAHSPVHAPGDPQGALPELLELDAEVLEEPLRVVREVIDELADAPVRSILDLGAGTGVGTFALLRHFPGASAVAVDASDDMLGRVRSRADELGLSDRVTTALADLDDGLPAVGRVDLAWASASLHHLADPDLTLTRLVEAIRPGGLLAVVELAGHPRFLLDDTPEGVAEARAHALISGDRAVDLPTLGGDWGPRLARAGLVVEEARTIEVDLVPPQPPVVSRYAAAVLSRIRGVVADRLDAADRERLDGLLYGGASDVRHRDDLRVRTVRQLWVARRPT